MAKSVCEQLQEHIERQVRALALTDIVSNITVCNDAFTASDIRPGGYITPEDREKGRNTNERDEWGYRWQVTVIRGSSSQRNTSTGPWQRWLQDIVREFNNKRLSLDTMPSGVNFSRACQAEQIKVPNEGLKKLEYDAVAVLLTVWVLETRTR